MTAEPAVDSATDYRPVSSLAVAALVAGCCSAVALVTRFAWVVPLIGVAVSLAALVDLARPDIRKAGRLAALLGLALSIGFGCQAVTGFLVDRWIMGSRARAAATAWINAVREGRTAEALGLCGPSVLPDTSMHRDPAHDEGGEERLARFANLPAVKAVSACGDTMPLLSRCLPAGTADGAWTLAADLGSCGDAGATLAIAIVPTSVRGTRGSVERWSVVMVGLER